MNEQEFMSKWTDESTVGIWAQNAPQLFWARSYQMPRRQLIEMSLDYLSIPLVEGHKCSSLHLAKETTRYRDTTGQVI